MWDLPMLGAGLQEGHVVLSTGYFRLEEVCAEARCITDSAESALKHSVFCPCETGRAGARCLLGTPEWGARGRGLIQAWVGGRAPHTDSVILTGQFAPLLVKKPWESSCLCCVSTTRRASLEEGITPRHE